MGYTDNVDVELEQTAANQPAIELLKLINSEKAVTLTDEIDKCGFSNLPTIKQVSEARKILRSTHNKSVIDVDRRLYLWTGEFYGVAPKGHPAQGKLILAKYDGLDKSVTPQDDGEITDTVANWGLKVSKTSFACCEDLAPHSHDQMDMGYIMGFKYRSGLMVPVGDVDSENWLTMGDTKSFERLREQGFPALYITRSHQLPVSSRPCSWYSGGTVIVNHDEPNCKFLVLPSTELNDILLMSKEINQPIKNYFR